MSLTADAGEGPGGGAIGWARHRAGRFALVLFGRLPDRVRRLVVRRVGCTFVAGAVAVLEQDGCVLLVRTVYRPGWGFPGGMLDRGEGPAEAVVRELREELGLAVEPVGRGHLVLDVDAQRLDVVYRVRATMGPLAPDSPGPEPGDGLLEVRPRSFEVAEVAWFPLDALPSMQPEALDALDALAHPERSPWVPVPPAGDD